MAGVIGNLLRRGGGHALRTLGASKKNLTNNLTQRFLEVGGANLRALSTTPALLQNAALEESAAKPKMKFSDVLEQRRKKEESEAEKESQNENFEDRAILSHTLVNIKPKETAPLKRDPITFLWVHGFLGTSANFKGVARRLGSKLANETGATINMVLVDQRHHGETSARDGFEGSQSLSACAEDLFTLFATPKENGGAGIAFPTFVFGHSFGGKVVLEYLEQCVGESRHPARAMAAAAVRNVWVLDCMPGQALHPFIQCDGAVPAVLEEQKKVDAYLSATQGLQYKLESGKPISARCILAILEAVRSLPERFDRKWLMDKVESDFKVTPPVKKWLKSSIRPVPNSKEFQWTFHAREAVELYSSYKKGHYWPLLENMNGDVEAKLGHPVRVDVLQAENSDRWHPGAIKKLEDLAESKEGSKTNGLAFHVLPDSAHWVHVDNVQGLLDILTPVTENILKETIAQQSS